MKKKGLLPVLLTVCLLIAGCGRTDIAKESTTVATSDSVQINENGSETADPESLSDSRIESGRNTEARPGGSETVSGYPAFDFEAIFLKKFDVTIYITSPACYNLHKMKPR